MVSEPVRPDDLMRFLDGEIAPEERARIEAALSGSTELQRELALFRAMKDDLSRMDFDAILTKHGEAMQLELDPKAKKLLRIAR